MLIFSLLSVVVCAVHLIAHCAFMRAWWAESRAVCNCKSRLRGQQIQHRADAKRMEDTPDSYPMPSMQGKA